MSQYFIHYTDTTLSLIGFGLFAIVFIGSVAWTTVPANKKNYDEIAIKILKEEGES